MTSNQSVIFAHQRIGPHPQDILSTIVGNLLGDGWFEKRTHISCRLHIHMSHRNQEYLHWLHAFYVQRGYASPRMPKLHKQIGKHGKVYFSLKFRTWSYTSFHWLYEKFYPYGLHRLETPGTRKKRVPADIQSLLTPQALAIWVMGDGSSTGPGLVLRTDSFCLQDIQVLQDACETNFHCRPSVQQRKKGFRLYFSKQQKPCIRAYIQPWMHQSLMYKIV
jgi:hypothetical protein